MNDVGNKLKSFSSNVSEKRNRIIIAEKGYVKDRKIFLFNGQIISSKMDSSDNKIINFDQINIDLSELNSSTIKQPKLQETSTIKLLNCLIYNTFANRICDSQLKQEIISVLSRRFLLPLYIPIITLICSLQLMNSEKFF